MKDLTKMVVGMLAGMFIGSMAQAIHDQKKLDKAVSYGNELLKHNDELRERNMSLQCDIENAKVTNWQVACYCQNLKKALDQFNE